MFWTTLQKFPKRKLTLRCLKFLLRNSRGTEEFFGLGHNRVDIINSTLGKALGGAAGGYTTGSKELISLLRQRARPYLFSNSLPPPVVACASKVTRVQKCTANCMLLLSRFLVSAFTSKDYITNTRRRVLEIRGF